MKARRHTHSTSSPPSSPSPPPPASSSSWIHLRSVFLVVVGPSSSSSSPASSSSSAHVATRGSLKSPWSRKRRKRALSPRLWKSLFATDGKIKDEVKFLKKVRSGGVDPRIREEVWPFLLGTYELNSTESERSDTRTHKRKEYENLRRQCRRMSRKGNGSGEKSRESSVSQSIDSPSSEDVVSARESLSTEGILEEDEDMERNDDMKQQQEEKNTDSKFVTGKIVEEEEEDKSDVTADIYAVESDSSETESSENESGSPSDIAQENGKYSNLDSLTSEDFKTNSSEDFGTWQRIIRLDASRENSDWVQFSSSQSSVSLGRARRAANAVELQDYEHMEPYRIYHAARLVAILEAYAIFDPEIGYCQGMCDLLSPIVAVVDEDHEAFWCFVGFMKKARHNFRLDEVGIKRQLNIVSKIIKNKDSHLYKHLEKLQAEDCFFVYRMVMVLFRRELTFEQTLCLWEVIWADQAAIRAGIGKSAWGKIRNNAPPTEDLLLYAIAACVLRRRKLIIEKYNSMDEILRECNDMSGQLDVWKLLDDAHDLVVTLHDKI